MTTTIPFERTSIETDYFKIEDVREFKANNRFAFERENDLKRFTKKADLEINYKFGKTTFKAFYSVYFNDIENVIEDLRNLYRGKQNLDESTSAFYNWCE